MGPYIKKSDSLWLEVWHVPVQKWKDSPSPSGKLLQKSYVGQGLQACWSLTHWEAIGELSESRGSPGVAISQTEGGCCMRTGIFCSLFISKQQCQAHCRQLIRRCESVGGRSEARLFFAPVALTGAAVFLLLPRARAAELGAAWFPRPLLSELTGTRVGGGGRQATELPSLQALAVASR